MMNRINVFLLKSLRFGYKKLFRLNSLKRPKSDQDPDSVSSKIVEMLTREEPCMIARFGANELSVLINYLGVNKFRGNMFSYVRSQTPSYWWDEHLIKLMHNGAGFFPPTIEAIEKYCELMLEDISEVDLLGSWLVNERFFDKELAEVDKVGFLYLDPYWSNIPWTKALEGKRVLVVHPFAETIKKQYKKRKLLFENDLLPEFELHTLKAVQSIAGTKTEFSNWFEALEYMQNEIDKIEYDICLIGAGAYGFNLAAHVKRSGKKAFHLGGSLQLLFGIRGKRWEIGYAKKHDYAGLLNEHWVFVDKKEKPVNAGIVENACYW